MVQVTVEIMANSDVLVLVLGAGVIGLTTAVTLAEAGHRVTVVADEIPGRTSLAAGASWGPYHVEPHDKVSTPGIDTFFSEDTGLSPDLTHYLPQGDHVVLGGVAVPGDWSREADPAIAASIITRCGEIEPLLRTAEVLEHRIGLRPTRA